MKKLLLLIILGTVSLNIMANEVKFVGPNSVIPNPVQQEMIAASIKTLINDCSVATKIRSSEVKKLVRGLEVNYSIPISFNLLPAGKVTNIKTIKIRLWDNAENSYGMDIYAFTNSGTYILGKYMTLGYPFINMILNPMPPYNSPKL